MHATNNRRSSNGAIALVITGLLLFLCASPCIMLGLAPKGESSNSPSRIIERQSRAYNKMQRGERLADGDVANLAGEPFPESSDGKGTILGIGVALLVVAALFILGAYLGFAR